MENSKFSKKRMHALINILFDDTAREDEKDDAAMFLRDFIDNEAINALTLVGCNNSEKDIVQGSAGESLAEIWCTQNNFDKLTFEKLTSTARKEAFGIIKHKKPDWLVQYQLTRSKI